MEKQTWRIGNFKSTVVSDTKIKNTNFPSPPNQEESQDDEIKYYGGFLICESIGNDECAKLIAAAPEMLEALQEVIRLRDIIELSDDPEVTKVEFEGEAEAINSMINKIESAIKKATE